MRQNRSLPYRGDPNNIKIDGGSEFVAVMNESLTSGAWTEIVLAATPNDFGCKAFIAHERDGNDWLFAIEDSPSEYYSVLSGLPLSANIARQHGETIFWARSVDPTGTLEIILLD